MITGEIVSTKTIYRNCKEKWAMPLITRSEEKLIALLVQLVKETGTDKLQLSIEEMSERTGLSPTTTYRALNSLDNRGIIRIVPVSNRREPNIVVWLGDQQKADTEEELLEQEFEEALRALSISATRMLSVFKRLRAERDEARRQVSKLETIVNDGREKVELAEKVLALTEKIRKEEEG